MQPQHTKPLTFPLPLRRRVRDRLVGAWDSDLLQAFIIGAAVWVLSAALLAVLLKALAL